MLYYCTLFDSNYISKGIALYLSLERHTDDFLLYVMAMDRKCEKMLKNMDFAHMHVEEKLGMNRQELEMIARGNFLRVLAGPDLPPQ